MFRRGGGGGTFGESPFFRGEKAAGDKKRFGDTAAHDPCRLDFSSVLFAETDHPQCFFDVQFARAALCIAAVVIEYAIGKVRVFLNFAEHEASANRMRGACRNKNSFSGAQRNVLQAILSRTILDGAFKYFRCN